MSRKLWAAVCYCMLLRNFSAEGLPIMVPKQLLVVLAHGFVGWALCAAKCLSA